MAPVSDAVAERLVRQEQRVRASEARLASLGDLCARLLTERDPAAVLRAACTIGRAVLEAETALAVVFEDVDAAVRRASADGVDADAAAAIFAPVEPRLMAAALAGAPLRARMDGVAGGAAAPVPSLYAWLSVPLAGAARAYGWIAVANKHGCFGFSDDDERVMQMIGRHAGLAFETAIAAVDRAGSTRQAGIAHDFNNVMTAILGFSRLLLEEAPAALHPDLDEIVKAAGHGRALAAELREISQGKS